MRFRVRVGTVGEANCYHLEGWDPEQGLDFLLRLSRAELKELADVIISYELKLQEIEHQKAKP